MKKLLYLSLLSATFGFSQETKIPIGEYKSDKSQTEKVTVLLQEGNKYQIAILSGIYEQKNDSLVFHSEYDSEPVFLLEYSNPNPKSNQLNLQFLIGNYSYYLNDKYIGIQQTASSEVEYKTVKELINYNPEDDEKTEYNIPISKPYALFFVKYNSRKGAVVEKYIVPQNTSSVSIAYNKNSGSKINLTGFYNKETKVLSVGEGKRSIINFKLNDGKEPKDVRVLPSESNLISKWTYPGKVEEEEYDYAVDTAVAAVDTAYASNYKFKLKIEKTFAEALKSAKNQQDRFLVVVNNPSDKNAGSNFSDFVKNFETDLSYYMYDKYDPTQDRFNFYNATEKDAKVLKNLGVKEQPSIVILNSDGTKIYHYKGKLEESDFSHYNSEGLYEELKTINEKVNLDKVFANKKASLKDIEDKLLDISNLQVPYDYNSDYAVEAVAPPVSTYETIPMEVKEVAADSTVALADSSNNYNIKKDIDYYKLKTTKKKFDATWAKILEKRLAEKEVNFTTVTIIMKQLNNDSFDRILFKDEKNGSNYNDISSVKYLIKHYNTIINTKQNDTLETHYDYNNLKYLVTDLLGKKTQVYTDEIKEYERKSMIVFKEFVAATNNDPEVYKRYIAALKDSDNKEEYVKEYQNYFNSVVKEDKNLIEELDNAYQLNEESGIDWTSFKYDFANNANSAAWYIFENSNDLNHIKTAIKWSETSLKIEKDNSYYLDTLAQLYYKNGEKQKAIITEQKAIDAVKEADSDQTQEYKKVLEKMKNGTY